MNRHALADADSSADKPGEHPQMLILLPGTGHYLHMDKESHITMLGTGNALVTRCYNTCFTIHCEDDLPLLVDAGGGNGILTQLERAGIAYSDIHNLFVTHAHTYHQEHLLYLFFQLRQ